MLSVCQATLNLPAHVFMYPGKYVNGAKFSVGGILGPGPGAFLNMINAARETVPADTSPRLYQYCVLKSGYLSEMKNPI